MPGRTPAAPESDSTNPTKAIVDEMGLIGSIICSRGGGREAMESVESFDARDFWRDSHRFVWSALRQIVAEGRDPSAVALVSQLSARGLLEKVGDESLQGARYILEALDTLPSGANASYYAGRVHQAAKRRRIIEWAHDAARAAIEPGIEPDALVERTLEAMTVLRNGVHAATDPAHEPVDLADVAKEDFPQIEYLIDGVLTPAANGYVGGPPKLGKSMVALHACICLATGQPFLGSFAVRPGARALYISEEDPRRIVHGRIQRMLKALPDGCVQRARMGIRCKAGFRIDEPESLAWLRKYLKAFPADLVVLDVLNRLHSKGQNKSEEITPMLAQLDKVRTEFGCAFWIVHHFKKSQAGDKKDQDAGEQLAGTVSLHGWSECSIYMDRKHGSRRLRFEAKEFEPHPEITVEFGSNPEFELEEHRPKDAPIYLRSVELEDRTQIGVRNRETAERAATDAWVEAGKPAEGIPQAPIAEKLEIMSAGFGWEACRKHLYALGFLARKAAGKGKPALFRPPETPSDRRDAEPISLQPEIDRQDFRA